MGVSLEETIQYNIFHKEIYNFTNLMYFLLFSYPQNVNLIQQQKRYLIINMSLEKWVLANLPWDKKPLSHQVNS